MKMEASPGPGVEMLLFRSVLICLFVVASRQTPAIYNVAGNRAFGITAAYKHAAAATAPTSAG